MFKKVFETFKVKILRVKNNVIVKLLKLKLIFYAAVKNKHFSKCNL